MAGGTENSTQGVNQNSLRITEKHLHFSPQKPQKSHSKQNISSWSLALSPQQHNVLSPESK